jgi:hypothetical protein
MVRAMAATEAGAAHRGAEVARGKRFEFGENWHRSLDIVDEERVAEGARST